MSVCGARAGIVDKRGAGAVAEKKYFRLRNTDSETQHFFQSLLDEIFLNVPIFKENFKNCSSIFTSLHEDDNVTLDSDSIWAKIQDTDSNSMYLDPQHCLTYLPEAPTELRYKILMEGAILQLIHDIERITMDHTSHKIREDNTSYKIREDNTSHKIREDNTS